MDFPVALTQIEHKAGGKITRITGIEHQTDKPEDGRSRDYWYFRGDVEWKDGSGKSENLEIAPYALIARGMVGKEELDPLLEALSEYLLANGEWCRDNSGHDGWYASVRPISKKRRRA